MKILGSLIKEASKFKFDDKGELWTNNGEKRKTIPISNQVTVEIVDGGYGDGQKILQFSDGSSLGAVDGFYGVEIIATNGFASELIKDFIVAGNHKKSITKKEIFDDGEIMIMVDDFKATTDIFKGHTDDIYDTGVRYLRSLLK